jgi:tRNA(adenine34) deaminase
MTPASPADEAVMRLAIVRARAGAAAGEIPIGAVVLDPDGAVIATAHNQREGLVDPTAHAWRLDGCTLVVTLEPCPMCAGAVVMSRISRLVFGAWNDEYGAAGSRWDLVRDRRLNHRAEVIGGVLADECGAIVREFLGQAREV